MSTWRRLTISSDDVVRSGSRPGGVLEAVRLGSDSDRAQPRGLAYFGWQPYLHNPALKRWLRRIRVPTLVVWGEADRWVSPDYGRRYADLIPGARFALIERAGHYPHIEQPSAFVNAVMPFVAPLSIEATLHRNDNPPLTRLTMQFYHFSEQPYTDAWDLGLDSLRNTIPNRLCDPQVAARIYHAALDEWLLCDELGINCMLNEHHASATCLSESPNIQLGILARQTHNVRLLALGHPIAVRSDPIRLAEEIAMIDCISRGRLEIGFVKGAPYEYSPANANPVGITERFWEANDLILKALSTRDGPFNFEGDHHHFRQVNIWPRPWQDPIRRCG